MRKFLITLLFLFTVSAPVFAQSPQITTQMTTTTTAIGTGIAVPTTGYHMITWTLAGPAPTACTVAVDSSADNSSWSAGGAIPGQTCTSGGQSAVVNLSTGYIRINVTAFTGTGTLKVFYLGTSGISGSSTTSTVSIGAPTGTCAQGALDTDKNTGNLYACNNGTWVLAGGGAGIVYSAGGGTAQAQTMTPSPASSSLNTGTTLYCWLPTAANTGAAPTLAISGLTAKPITKYGTVALVANDITTAGVACVIYDGTEFQLQVPLAGGVYSSSLSLGSGASSAGATATGGFACVEAASTGWTPTVGQDYLRCDLTLHNYVLSLNGGAEVPIGNITGQTNVYGAFLQDFTAATMELPEAAGFTTNVNSTIGLDTTANTCKVWVNSADAICAVEATAIAAGFLPKSTDATHGLLTISLLDEGITNANAFTVGDTAGLVAVKIGTGAVPPACAVATSAWCGVESVPPTAVAGVDDLWPDSTDHSWKAHSNGNGIELVTLVSPGPIHQTAQTAAITTATLCTTANCGVAGNYTIEWAFTQVGTACGTPGAGGVTFLLTWTDQNAVTHSAIQMPMDDAASLIATTGTFHFTASNATAWGSGNMNISSNGAILQYATGYTACGVGTGSYQLDAWVTRKR